MQNSIPYNLEAEVAVLGGLLNDPEKIYEIREILYPECFYDKKHRIIYDAILSLVQNNKAIDLLTTVDELKNNNKLIEAGDVEYLTKLSESVSIATNIYSYAQIVYDKSLIRETINEAKQIIDKAQSVDNADDVIEFAGTRMVALSKLMRSTDFLNWDEILDQSLTKLHELRENNTKLTGLDTGYKILNDKTNGFHGGELIVIAARPSMGKTAFALNLMHNIATSTHNKEPHIAFFSLEMPADQIINRLLAIQSLIPMSKIKNEIPKTTEKEDFEQFLKEFGPNWITYQYYTDKETNESLFSGVAIVEFDKEEQSQVLLDKELCIGGSKLNIETMEHFETRIKKKH